MTDKKTANKILSEIKKAKKILLALHVSPDPDGAASVLALDLVLQKMGKETKLISYSQIPFEIACLPGIEKIKVVDFTKENLADFDLFIALDSAQARMVTRSPWPEKFPPNFKIINIDHHVSGEKFGDINLVEIVSSTAEVLYDLFLAWGIKIGKEVAYLLFWGIFADTGCFQYPSTTPKVLRTAADLLENGGSLNDCVLLDFRSYNFKTLKYWGRILANMQMDESGLFIWSKITRAENEELGVNPTEIMSAATLFAPIVFGTKFGIILHEEKENLVRGSLRSRVEDFDVSKIAEAFSGGGHQRAAGFSLAIPMAEAEKKVLAVARKLVARQ